MHHTTYCDGANHCTFHRVNVHLFVLFSKFVPIIHLHNTNGLFFSVDTVFSVRYELIIFFCDLDVMSQFVPNYVHAVGENCVPGSLHVIKNNIETLHLP